MFEKLILNFLGNLYVVILFKKWLLIDKVYGVILKVFFLFILVNGDIVIFLG